MIYVGSPSYSTAHSTGSPRVVNLNEVRLTITHHITQLFYSELCVSRHNCQNRSFLFSLPICPSFAVWILNFLNFRIHTANAKWATFGAYDLLVSSLVPECASCTPRVPLSVSAVFGAQHTASHSANRLLESSPIRDS